MDTCSIWGGSGGSVVQVEVARRLLLEPQLVVVRCVLEELGGLLEHVVLRRVGVGRTCGGRRVVGPRLVVNRRPREVLVAEGRIAVRLRRPGLGRLDPRLLRGRPPPRGGGRPRGGPPRGRRP